MDQYKSVLCLNGELPKPSFFNKLNLPIIAADGSANYLAKNDLLPKAIVGDLDSIDIMKFQQCKLVHVPNQAFSDFQKSIHYIKINDLFPSIILGISGGYLDHILNNINIFLQTDSIFFAPPIVGHIINSENIRTSFLPLLFCG